MGKVNNALCMLALLRSRKKMSRKELADMLEVTPRQISRYKEDLQMAGIDIIETTGKYGGYELVGCEYLLDVGVTSQEKILFQQAVDLLKGQGFLYTKEIEILGDKIFRQKFKEEIAIEAKNHINFNHYKEEKEKWSRINEARIFSKKLCIEYMNTNREITERVVHPYTIYTYGGANYLVAYCEQRQAIRQFKLIRIQGIQLLEEPFKVDSSFDSQKYLAKCIGMYKDEILDLKLKVFYPYAQYFKENQWVTQEKIEDFPEQGYLIYSAQMEGKTQIKSWVLQMGMNCIVLEPKAFQEEIKETYKKCLGNY